MIFDIQDINDVKVIKIINDALDASNIKDFKNDIAIYIESCKNIILDLSDIKFIDSSGLGSIISCLRQLHSNNGELKLSNLTKPVKALFELVRLHKIFEIYNSNVEAANSFK